MNKKYIHYNSLIFITVYNFFFTTFRNFGELNQKHVWFSAPKKILNNNNFTKM